MNLDISVSSRPRWNIVKQIDISILCIHKKEKGFFFVPNVRKLEGKIFHS